MFSSSLRAAGLLAAAALCLCLSLCLPSCTSKNRLPGYVYYRLTANPSTLDPALITDVPGGQIAAKLFNGLVRIGDSLGIEGDIAERWTVSPDGLIYRFSLKKGVRFSNGREVSAQDFKYSFERVLSKRSLSPNRWVLERLSGSGQFTAGLAEGVKGIKVTGPYGLELRLDEPFSPFLSLLAMPAAYVVPREESERLGQEFSSQPVGTGPFALDMWLQGQELRLRARADYFEGAPKSKGIIYRVIPEDLTAAVEFELGNLDALGVPASVYSRYKENPKWKPYISMSEGLNIYYLGLNCSRPPFDNRRLRQAVSHAIDRRKILESFLESRGTIASGPVPSGLRAWGAPSVYDYDPAKAKRILKEEGLEGLGVRFFITSQEEVADMAEIIQAYLARVGIKAELRQLEWSAYKEAINKGEPDMFWLSWWADYPEPENFLFPLFHSANHGAAGNRTRYSNAEADRLIEKGQRARSGAESSAFYGKAEALITADAPFVFFWHKKDVVLRQPRLRNYNIYPVYSMDKGVEVFID